MTTTEIDMENVMEAISAYTYLMTAKQCIENARIRLRHTDMEIEDELWDMYKVLDKLLRKLYDVFKVVKE